LAFNNTSFTTSSTPNVSAWLLLAAGKTPDLGPLEAMQQQLAALQQGQVLLMQQQTGEVCCQHA
jgi:hypothetical protein